MSTSLVRNNGSRLTFDAVPRLQEAPSITLSQHPLEDGGTITDHSYKNNTPVGLQGVVTYSPLETQTQEETATGAERVAAARAFLADLDGELVTLDSSVGTWEGVVVTRFGARWVARADAAVFDIEVQEVRLASAESVDVPVADRYEAVGIDKGAGGTDAGEQPTSEAGEGSSSLAKSLLGSLLG